MAARLGYASVGRMLREMDATEVVDWQNYFQLEKTDPDGTLLSGLLGGSSALPEPGSDLAPGS